MPTPRETGRYEVTTTAGEEVRAFLPHPLPPANPPLVFEGTLARAHDSALAALDRLELAGAMVPSVEWFVYGFVRKEAVLSSRIEGTQSTLLDLLAFESSGATTANPDLEEVCNYLDALAFARNELRREDGLPLSLRLLNEVHRRLMNGVRGADKLPGEVRRSQNWIGGTRPGNAVYVPPPPHALAALLSDLERYLHAQDDLPPLVRVALVHVQFESLHPYLDGNGRAGRMLITLLLEAWGLLSQPLLFLSLYLLRHRDAYYERLGAVRAGDWEGWVEFFLEGVATTSNEAVATARGLFARVSADRERVLAVKTTTVMGLRLLEHLPQHPIVTAQHVTRALDTTMPTALKAIELLESQGILVEITGRQRDREYRYDEYLRILGAEEAPPLEGGV
ncbi:MAG: Fic family protein [Planctomycetes bacterium]|nr:Fic family protein [Planctomycetota bacterium]